MMESTTNGPCVAIYQPIVDLAAQRMCELRMFTLLAPSLCDTVENHCHTVTVYVDQRLSNSMTRITLFSKLFWIRCCPSAAEQNGHPRAFRHKIQPHGLSRATWARSRPKVNRT